MAQQNFLEKLLDVRRSEWRTLIWLMLFMFTESVASEILNIVALSDFVKGAGIRGIPLLYIFDEVLLSALLAVYAALQNRIERTKLFNLFEACFGTLILFLWLGFNLGMPGQIVGIATYAVKSLAISIVEEIFWQFVDEIYDVREAKRLTSVITTSGTVGSMVGAAGLGALLAFMIPADAPQAVGDKVLNNFRLVATVVMFSGIFFMNRVRAAATAEGRLKDKSKKKDKPVSARKKDKKQPTFRDGLDFMKSSPMFRAIFITFVIAGVVAPLGDFAFQATIDLYSKDKKAYATFFSIYSTSLQVFLFLANLFLSGRLMKRVGLSNSQLFTPMNNILKFGLYLPLLSATSKIGLWVAVYSQGTKKIFEKVIQKPAQRILFGFAPKKQKNVVRVFTKQMKGYAAIFTLVTLYLSLQIPAAGTLEDVDNPGTRILFIKVAAAILVVLNVVWLYYSFVLKRVFAESLVQILQTQEVDFDSLEREGFRSVIDNKAVMFLWKNLEAGDDKRAIFICEILGEIGDSRLLRPIAELMPKKEAPVKRALIKLAGRIGHEEAKPLLVNALRSRDAGVRAEALRAIRGYEIAGIYGEVKPLVNDEDEDVRVAAAAILLHSTDVELKKEGSRVLDTMLRSDDSRRRVNAIFLLGNLGVKRNLRAVVPFLKDPQFEVRLEALKSLGELSEPGDDANVDAVAALLDDPKHEVRAEAARALGRIGSAKGVPALERSLSQRGFAARKAAITALAAISAESRAALVQAISNPDVDLMTKELVLRELRGTEEEERVRATLVPILDGLLKGIYARVAARAPLPKPNSELTPGLSLLQKAIADVNAETRDLVLSILIILADPERYKLIRKGLLAGDKSTKANMLELLESTSERTVFNLLIPLLEETAEPELLAIGRKTWNIATPDEPAAFKSCIASSDKSIRLAAIYAAGELRRRDLASEVGQLTRSQDPATALEARRALALLQSSR